MRDAAAIDAGTIAARRWAASVAVPARTVAGAAAARASFTVTGNVGVVSSLAGLQPCTEIIPESDAEFGGCVPHQAEEGVATVAPGIAVGTAAAVPIDGSSPWGVDTKVAVPSTRFALGGSSMKYSAMAVSLRYAVAGLTNYVCTKLAVPWRRVIW